MPFNAILKDLALRTRAQGAVMLASDGEIVAGHTESPNVEIDLIGAHHGIVLSAVRETGLHGDDDVRSVVISTRENHLIISTLKEGYFVVVVLDKRLSPARALFNVKKAARAIEEEMG